MVGSRHEDDEARDTIAALVVEEETLVRGELDHSSIWVMLGSLLVD